MSRRDIFTDVAAILHPVPQPPGPDGEDDEGLRAARQAAAENRERDVEERAEGLREKCENDEVDPLLRALRRARRDADEAQRRINELLAYGREFVQPRPYTLGDLAAAAGMSISGVRTAYDQSDVDTVARATGTKPRH